MDVADDPQPGQRYRHFMGHIYTIICRSSRDNDMVPLVTYSLVEIDDQNWTRPLTEFTQRIKINDFYIPRFVRVADPAPPSITGA